jgi:hypothetical protein
MEAVTELKTYSNCKRFSDTLHALETVRVGEFVINVCGWKKCLYIPGVMSVSPVEL